MPSYIACAECGEPTSQDDCVMVSGQVTCGCLEDKYQDCDICKTEVLSGDIMYVEHTEAEVCEYCYDTEMEMFGVSQ